MPSRLADRADRVLVAAAAFGLERPWTTLALALLLAALSVASGFGMRFHAEVSDLVPASVAGPFRRLEEVFGAGESAFLLVTASRPAAAELVELARQVEADLESEPLVRSVTFGWSELSERFLSPGLLARAPLFAGPGDLEELRSLFTPEGIAAQVRKQALQLDLPGLGEAEEWIRRDPLELRRFLLRRVSALKGDFRFLAGSLHFLSEDARSILIRVDGKVRSEEIPAVKTIVAAIRAAVDRATAAIRAAAASPLDLEVGLTGSYAIAFETEASVRADLTWNNVGSMALVLVLVALAYRQFLLVLPSFAALTIGMVIGFGAFSLIRREIVTLAFVSGAALAGLGIDYVIYVTMRSFSDPRGPSTASVLAAVRATGRSIIVAAAVTAAAFFSFPLTGEKFLSDVGILSGVGMLTCGAAAIVVLPALLAPWARRGDRGESVPRGQFLQPRDFGARRLARPALAWPRMILAVSALSGIASVGYLIARPPELDRDLLRMYPRDSVAIRTQRAVAETFGGSEAPIIVLVEGDSPPEGRAPAPADLELDAIEAAARLDGPLRRLLDHEVITAWTSPTGLVPRTSEQRAARDVLLSVDAAELERAFRSALEAEGFEPEAFREAADVFRQSLRPPELVTPDLLRGLGLGEELGRLVGTGDGRGFAIVAVHPSRQLWRSDDQERVFVELEGALEEAGTRGDVAGLQALSGRGAAGLLGQFLRVSALASVVIAVVVVLFFRGFLRGALALLPVTLGTLWMMVACDLLGVGLNFMNVGVLPIVLGTGADIGIHMARQYFDDPGDVRGLVERTGGSVMLASLTTLASFGTMAFSTNPGLASVGAMATIGTIGCLVAALVTVPAAVELHAGRRRKEGSESRA
jgi:predicted RND superfamily exporter protein